MSKIDDQIKELQSRKKSTQELGEVIKSLSKMISDKPLQEQITKFVSKAKENLENGLAIEDITPSTAKTHLTDEEVSTLKTFVQKINQRTQVHSEKNAIVEALSVPETRPDLKKPQTSQLGDLDPIRFHQLMRVRMGLGVTTLTGKPLGKLINQDYPNVIIQKEDGNTLSLHANKVFIDNPKES